MPAESIPVNASKAAVAAAVRRIRDRHGIGEAAFSKRPLSLYKSLERRQNARAPFDVPIYLYPVHGIDRGARGDWESPVMGVTSDLSQQGVGFHYDAPIRAPFVLVEFDLFGGGLELLVVEFFWSRKNAAYSYSAGGHFVGVAEPK